MRLTTPIAELPVLSFAAEPDTIGSTREEMEAYERGEIEPLRRTEIEVCARLAFQRLVTWQVAGSC